MVTVGEARPNYHTHALTRGLQLVETVAASHPDPVTLGDLHAVSGVPKSTIVRLLGTLTDTGYLVRADERPSYLLGPAVLRIASPYLASLDVADLVNVRLKRLAEQTRQTANLGVLDGVEVLHVAVRSPGRPLYYDAPAGGRAPVYNTGLGKALLAALPPGRIGAHLPAEPWEAIHAGRGVTSRADLLLLLDETRRQGFAFDDNEFAEGLRCVAVPLGPDVPAALSVSGPSGEFEPDDRDRYVALLRETAADLAGDATVLVALRAAARA